MRAHHRSDAVVRGLDGGHPVAQRFVHRVLQCATARRHGNDLGAEQLHAEDVERLPFGVDLAHVDHAVETEERGSSGRRDTVLAGACLGDETALAHVLRQQGLAEDVVHLV